MLPEFKIITKPMRVLFNTLNIGENEQKPPSCLRGPKQPLSLLISCAGSASSQQTLC